MAIRVQHGRVEDVGKLAQEAGRAEASQAAAQRQTQIDVTMLNNAARMSMQQQQIDAQKDMADFKAFTDAEAEKRRYAWQVERDQMVRDHDFQMFEQRKQLLMDEINQKMIVQEKQRSRAADNLDELYDEGKLSEDEYNRAMVQIQSGYKMDKVDPMEKMLSDMMKGQSDQELTGSAQQVDPINENLVRSNLLQHAIDSGNPELEKVARDGDMLRVVRELRKTTKEGQAVQAKANFLRDQITTLERTDPVSSQRLVNILASGNDKAIEAAYKESVDAIKTEMEAYVAAKEARRKAAAKEARSKAAAKEARRKAAMREGRKLQEEMKKYGGSSNPYMAWGKDRSVDREPSKLGELIDDSMKNVGGRLFDKSRWPNLRQVIKD